MHFCTSFNNNIAKRHPLLWGVAVFFAQFFWDVNANVVANLIAPVVQEHIVANNDKPTKELVSDIKKIPSCIGREIETSQLRFVIHQNVFLYDKAKKSVIIEQLKLGQILKVIHKDKNWLEVSYIDADGESVHGWILTRYTARFIK